MCDDKIQNCINELKKNHPFHKIINITNENQSEKELLNADVVAKDIHGIVYYIDQFNNVYKTEDILNEKKNPEIIAKCEIINGEYGIRAFGLV